MIRAVAVVALVLLSVSLVSGYAVICPNDYRCIAIGANCSEPTEYVDTDCVGSGFKSSSGRDCICIEYSGGEITDDSVAGATCTSSNTWSDLSNHYCTRSSVKYSAPIQPDLKWYKMYKIQDVCTNDYWCAPPRRCVGGRCVANLAEGSVCINGTSYSTSMAEYGMCPVNTYCNYTYTYPTGYLGWCVPKVALGGACSTSWSDQCVPQSTCDSTHRICMIDQEYVLAAGVKANSSSQCESGLWNTTYGSADYHKCLDLTTIKTLAIIGTSCNDTNDCGDYAYCSCNNMGRNNRAICKSYYSSNTVALYQSERAREISNKLKLYTAGCEQSISYTKTTDFCTFRSGYDFGTSSSSTLAEYCAARALRIENGEPDCSGTYTALCGAFQTMTVSFGAIVAMALFAWLGPKY